MLQMTLKLKKKKFQHLDSHIEGKVAYGGDSNIALNVQMDHSKRQKVKGRNSSR